jgi:uncharacterized damage-inducible protein DinB
MDDLQAQLVETWRANQRINLLLLGRISDEGLRCTLSTRGGRDVARQFAHLHDVRVMWLESRDRAAARGLTRFASKESPDRERLAAALAASSEAVERFLSDCAAGRRRKPGFRRGVVTALGYFIAHESHHRGSILLTLKQCGHGLDQETRYAIWDWDRV